MYYPACTCIAVKFGGLASTCVTTFLAHFKLADSKAGTFRAMS